MVLRFLCAGGRKDFAFCRTSADFRSLCDEVDAGTDIVVFQHAQLPLRGYVTDEFIDSVLGAIPDGSEFLIVNTEPYIDVDVYFLTLALLDFGISAITLAWIWNNSSRMSPKVG